MIFKNLFKIKFLVILFLFSLLSCSKDKNQPTKDYKIWNGPSIEFTKLVGANPKDKLNQDEITASVSITRGDNGEIYNALLEEKAQKEISPLGTEWAIGETSNIANLSFSSFRKAVGKPKNVVGKNLVLHIIKEDVYLSVQFTNWGQSQKGNFSYRRSTKN